MSNTYSWQFESFDVYPTYGAFTEVVQSIHWILIADDGSGHTAKAYGEDLAGPPDPDSFTPYRDLTATIVQGWVEAILGSELDSVKAYLDSRIAEQVSPTTESLPPPWA